MDKYYENLSKEELIELVKGLTIIRINYEKKFGVVMYTNGETEKYKYKGLN